MGKLVLGLETQWDQVIIDEFTGSAIVLGSCFALVACCYGTAGCLSIAGDILSSQPETSPQVSIPIAASNSRSGLFAAQSMNTPAPATEQDVEAGLELPKTPSASPTQ